MHIFYGVTCPHADTTLCLRSILKFLGLFKDCAIQFRSHTGIHVRLTLMSLFLRGGAEEPAMQACGQLTQIAAELRSSVLLLLMTPPQRWNKTRAHANLKPCRSQCREYARFWLT